MTIPIEIERDWVRIAGQTVYRPENIVPGDWLSFWDDAVSPVDYQEAFDEGAESVENGLAEEIKGLEDENAELRSEISDLENEIDNLEMEIEQIKELEGLDY